MKTLLPLLLLTACLHSRPGIMTWSEYAQRSVQWPYIFRACGENFIRTSPSTREAEIPGLIGSPASSAEVQAVFLKYFPSAGGYPSAKMFWFDPMKNETVFNEISRASNEYRDRYMVELLVRHLQEGERVFAVVGGTHVVMQEPALHTKRVRCEALHLSIALRYPSGLTGTAES